MDSLSQAALGAAIGEALLGKRIGKAGAIIGAGVATIPDLDVVLLLFADKLESFSIHRGYSHSLLFCIAGAFILAWLFTKFKYTKSESYWRLWLFTFLTLFTHVLLDAFTSYGTQIFLPLTDWRVSFDSISIVDPVYTLPLIIGVVSSIYFYKQTDKKRSFPNTIGLIVSTLYLLFTLTNKQNIETVFKDALQKQEILSYRILTVPVAAGNTVWYGVARDDKELHIGKYSLLERTKIEFESFPINDELLDDLDPYLVDRMRWFAKGFYTVAEYEGKIRLYNMQCDMQGTRHFGAYVAPTASYFEITPKANGDYELTSGMHPEE